MSNILLLSHPLFGVLAILAAVWVIVETINATPENQARIRTTALAVAVLVWLSYVLGGYWYVAFYGADKAVILKGPWPEAHKFFMETKEHAFFILLFLATFLPIAASNDLPASKPARRLVAWTASLIVLLGLLMDGHGAIIGMGVKLGLMPH